MKRARDSIILSAEYRRFISELKSRVVAARISAARAVNRDVILLYWDIGRGIVEKQKTRGWGESVVEMVSADLRKAFPDMRGFSANNVWLMRQFFSEYSAAGFLEQLVQEMGNEKRRFLPQLVAKLKARPSKSARISAFLEQFVQELLPGVPWGHHVEIVKKVKAHAARLYYLKATAHFGWTRNVLLNQIKAGAYERSLKDGKRHNFALALPEHIAEQAEEALKSSYNLEFLGIRRAVKERELEDRLIDQLRDFILELGYGFCFVGRQYRLALGQKEYFIDLLFYHRFLKSLVAFELKVGPFQPEFAGKMDFYLNVLNDKERAASDNPSIGVILCAEKDDVEVEYALKSKRNPIGVAVYRLQSKLPAHLKGKLPSARQLSDAVRAALPGRGGE